MPYIYKELNNLHKAEVSKLWIVDAHAVVIPSNMFAQVKDYLIPSKKF